MVSAESESRNYTRLYLAETETKARGCLWYITPLTVIFTALKEPKLCRYGPKSQLSILLLLKYGPSTRTIYAILTFYMAACPGVGFNFLMNICKKVKAWISRWLPELKIASR